MKFGKKEKETQEEEVVRGEIQRVVPDYRVGLNPEQIRIREENGWTNDEVTPPGLTTKEIVHKFNSVYGDTLIDPKILLPENQACLRLPGIDGKAKMSKSLGNCIYLSEEPEEIKKKVFSMFTDPTHIRVEDPGKLEGNTVFTYLDAFCRPEYFAEFLPEYSDLDELKAHYQRGGLGDMKVKRFLNNVLQAELEPIRNRRKEFSKDIPAVYEMLKKGSEKAEAVAAQTLAEVKAAMKINYFDDTELIKAQSEQFAE